MRRLVYFFAVPGFARAKKWSSCEVNSFIFVWYHAQKEQPSWSLTPLPHLAPNQWRYRGRNEFYISAHIQVLDFFFNSKNY